MRVRSLDQSVRQSAQERRGPRIDATCCILYAEEGFFLRLILYFEGVKEEGKDQVGGDQITKVRSAVKCLSGVLQCPILRVLHAEEGE